MGTCSHVGVWVLRLPHPGLLRHWGPLASGAGPRTRGQRGGPRVLLGIPVRMRKRPGGPRTPAQSQSREGRGWGMGTRGEAPLPHPGSERPGGWCSEQGLPEGADGGPRSCWVPGEDVHGGRTDPAPQPRVSPGRQAECGTGPRRVSVDFQNWQQRPGSEAGVPQDTELRTRGPEPLVQFQPESDTMSLGKSNELWELGEDPEEAQGLLDTQQSRAQEEEEGQVPSPPSPSLSSSPYFSLSGVLPGTPQEGSALEGSLSPLQSSQSANSFPYDGAASGLGQPQLAGPNSPGEVVASGSEGQEDADPYPRGGASGGLGQPQPAVPSSPEEVGSSPPEQQEDEQPEGSFHMKTAALVMLLLLKYRIKQPISKAEMLEVITPEFQDDFPVILSQASRCLRLVLGLDVIEVDPSEHCYHLNIILGLTWDGMVSGQGGLPKTSLLGLVLGLIVLEDDCAPEEEVWEALRVMEVYDGQEHIIYGEPRDLLTNVWVQEGYLECRPVVGSNPARYEFLWGPRAHVETSKFQVMDYAFQVSSSLMVSSLALCEQILR
ncbi:uncharacterized protein [Canis lupus baileyi]